MTRLVDSLAALQEALDHIAKAEDTLENLPPAMRDLHQRYRASKQQIDDAQERIDAGTHDHRQAEAETADWQSKVQRLQEQIRSVKTQREYGAILSEIDQATEHKSEAEAAALAALESVEAAEQELEGLRRDFSELEQEYSQAEAQWLKDKPGVEAQRVALAADVERLRGELPAPIRARFERILTHTQGQAMSAVVPIDRGKGASLWACSNCSYRVRPQAVVEIRTSGKVVQCEGCRRFLYVDEDARSQEAS